MPKYTDPLAERGHALEEAFFASWNEELRKRLHAEEEHEAAVRSLAGALGFRDEKMQDHLVALGISAETLPAFALAPLVVIAWASGEVTEDERTAVLGAAHDEGIERGTPAHQLLEGWLSERPPSTLLENWVEYASALETHTPASHREWLRDEMSRRAQVVARASGGVAGIYSISATERAVIDAIEGVF